MTRGRSNRSDAFGPSLLVYAVGAALAIAAALTAYGAPDVSVAVEAAMVGILALAILARGLTLQASDRDTGDRWRIAAWGLVGTLAASLLAGIVLLRAVLRGDAITAPLLLVELVAGVGALAGLFVGSDQVRAIAAGRDSERKHTSELLAQRESERLTFLNNLLRHNVLNGMNIVLGYTAALKDRLDDQDEYVQRIRTQGESIVELVQNVQVLVRSLSGDLDVDAVDLTETARVQAQRAEQDHGVTIETDLDPDVVVATTPFVSSAIENLLSNAAVHTDSDAPEIRISVERRAETGVVCVTDDGPGIPDDVVDTAFGDRDDHFVGDGLGLYLVDELVTAHGGDIDLETDENGTTIRLEFPLATDYDEPREPVEGAVAETPTA